MHLLKRNKETITITYYTIIGILYRFHIVSSSSQAQNLPAYVTGNAHVAGIHIPSEKAKGRNIIPANKMTEFPFKE